MGMKYWTLDNKALLKRKRWGWNIRLNQADTNIAVKEFPQQIQPRLRKTGGNIQYVLIGATHEVSNPYKRNLSHHRRKP